MNAPKLTAAEYAEIEQSLEGCKQVASRHASYYSAMKDAEVVLVVRTYANGKEFGQVTCEGHTLHIGTGAEAKFNSMAATEEMLYALMRAKVRATCHGFHPGEL
jgi:hypothetical protein